MLTVRLTDCRVLRHFMFDGCNSKFLRALSVVLISFFAPLSVGVAAGLPQIWLTPTASEDYMSLFTSGAPWQTVEKHVSVFKIYPEFAQHASDDDIRRLVAGLAARHIELAVESPVLGPTGWCEPGHPRTEFIAPLMARLKKLGANVGFLAMVGPLVDGHSYTKQFRCHLPIEPVAADAAHTIALVREIYPDIVVGDIEPVGAGNGFPDWSELDAWFAAWKKASGKPMGFLQTDVSWHLPWREDLKHFAERASADQVPFGVILDGDNYDLSDEAYSDDVARHVEEVTSLLGPLLKQVNFQSWQKYPRHALPETTRSSMTGEILDFLRPATMLTTSGSIAAGNLRSRLMDVDGAPVANASIAEESFAPDRDDNLAPDTISGFVPAGAAEARFILRSQVECSCPKRITKVFLTGFKYTEDGKPVFQWDVSSWATALSTKISPATIEGVHGLRISADVGQPVLLNGPLFSVTPGAAFVLSFAWQVAPESDHAGSVEIIFTRANKSEILRSFRTMATTWRTSNKIRTDKSGYAIVSWPASLPRSGLLRLNYPGDQDHRPAAPVELMPQ